jgi:hypothetical protein
MSSDTFPLSLVINISIPHNCAVQYSNGVKLSMPNKPSWLLRVNEILEDLGGAEMAAHPFLTRASVEKLFGLKRRQAIELMHSVEGYQIGKTLVLGRAQLAAWLRRASVGEQVWWEQVRHTRVEEVLEEVWQEREARKQRALVPPSTLELKLEGMPPTVTIRPGELRILFSGADDLFRQLFEMAQAMKNDYERSKALAGG